MAFKKGESGNPGGRPTRGKILTDALITALQREAKDCDGKPTRRLYVVADALVRRAQEGDIAAIREVFDRVEGKAEATTNINVKRDAREYTDAELASIIAQSVASRAGVDEPPAGEGEPGSVH